MPETTPPRPRRIFITVAEASADLHAANFVRAVRAVDPSVEVEALGGARLREAGAVVHHETVARAAMGWRAAFRAAEVHRLLRWTREYYERNRPDLHVCCDSWSMNVHFAKLAKERGVPVLYYIAPQTWASREGRVQRMRAVVDQVACIWPFEEQYFRGHGLHATFVGHPLFDEIPRERPMKPLLPPGEPPVVGLLGGSRKSIARQNFPRQLEVARRILGVFPEARFLVPTTAATHGVVSALAEGFPNLTLKLDAFDEMVPRCDLCVSVSGTATLHAAAYGTPLVVVYHVNPLAWHLVGRWVVKTRTYSMVNYLSGQEKHIVPEFIPWYGPVDAAAERAIGYLRDPASLEGQRGELLRVIRPLDRPGASRNAAELAMAMVGNRA
jgi:lipid-A-disaccharide synthase